VGNEIAILKRRATISVRANK